MHPGHRAGQGKPKETPTKLLQNPTFAALAMMLLLAFGAAIPKATTLLAGATTTAATCALTSALTEGPYRKAGAPARANLAATTSDGVKLALSGCVVNETCRPVTGATVDVWHADAKGVYGNAGYTLRQARHRRQGRLHARDRHSRRVHWALRAYSREGKRFRRARFDNATVLPWRKHERRRRKF